MCDTEIDNKRSIFNTKCYVLIKIKDYPIGKNLKCYVWFEGIVKNNEVENYVKNSMTLSETYKNYPIADIKIVSTLATNSMKPEDKFGELILQSITNVYEGNPKKEKEKKYTIKDIDYSKLTDKEIEDIDRKINAEIFKRKHNLNDSEYKFYIANREEVDINNVKEIYEKCDGDIFKFRKERIRENISSMLENKKVVK